MALNLAALRVRVRRPFKWDADDTEAMAVVDAAINDAYDMVNGHRHWKGLVETETSTVTGNSTTIDVPTTWRTFNGIFVINASGAARELEYIGYNVQETKFGDPAELTRGTPGRYLLESDTDGALGARKFVARLVPYPNATFTIRQVGYVQVAQLSAETDVPWFDAAYHGMLSDFALADLMGLEAGWDPALSLARHARGKQRLDDMIWNEPTATTPTYSIPLIAGT